MVIEFLGGLLTNSLALMADAGHMLTDVAALGLSLFALNFALRPATAAKTYGFHRVEILAALLNGITLFLISLLIVYKAYARIMAPPEVRSGMMLVIAVLGLIVNLVSAYFLHQTQASSLNIKGALLHVLGDALGSVAAIAASLLMLFKHWYLADPFISILVALLILCSAWVLLRDSVDILLEGTPAHIDLKEIRKALCVDTRSARLDPEFWFARNELPCSPLWHSRTSSCSGRIESHNPPRFRDRALHHSA
jgi:cobalt-zinc-cadmium efflux system protein